MTDFLTSTAEALAAALRARAEFSQPLPAVRSYADWDVELATDEQLHCDVVPVGYTDDTPAEDRESFELTTEHDIGLRYRFPPSLQDPRTGRVPVERVDQLVALLEEIGAAVPILGVPGTWSGLSLRLAYHPRLLREARQYTGILRVSYYHELPFAA